MDPEHAKSEGSRHGGVPRESRPHLHLVDEGTGELLALDDCPNCKEFRIQLAGADKEIRGWRTRYYKLAEDKEADARKDPLWREALEVFRYWQEKCKHPRAEWRLDRFELIRPYIRDYGPKMCRRAIDGAAFDPFITRRKNGTRVVHDKLTTIFQSSDKFEDFCNRAPLEGPGCPAD
jgi:hypothetical protein